MAVAYKAPGVYREEVFLQPEARLPIGIPGFVGFADAVTALERLPEGIEFPASLKDKLDYDADKKLLIFKGVMSPSVKDELLALSSDTAFQKSVEALFQTARSVVAVNRKQEFTDRFITPSENYLAEAVIGFFENGGTRCYIARANPKQDAETALKDALEVLAPLNDLDLVAIPDAMTLRLPDRQPDRDGIIRVQQAVLAHCAKHGDRLAILDAVPGSTAEAVINQRDRISINQKEPLNGALYYPWIKNTRGRMMPPCGHIAGIYARSDRAKGVFKAPANEEIRDALDLEVRIDNTVQDQLNPQGINCLRAFRGRGIRVWGARTLSRDANWRYINVRRLFLTLGRWIDRNMLWASFEPNTPQLWVRIERELRTYLESLWQVGALQGQTAEQAFFIKCDAETNPPESREIGAVITEIGLAASSPAEFLVVRIIHRVGAAEIT